jgi:hypothetical protein
MESSWNFIEKGIFSEAISKATEEYNTTKSLASLSNRATASIMMNNYENALNDYLTILNETEDRYKSDTNYIKVGVGYWLVGEYAKASQMFMNSMILKLPYTGNVIIPPAIVYFASVVLKEEKMKKDSLKYLKNFAKKKLSLALFLLNEIDETQLLDTIAENSPIRSRMLCKYELYIATKYLENGEREEFYNHLQKSVDTGKLIEFEYFIALSELNKRTKS